MRTAKICLIMACALSFFPSIRLGARRHVQTGTSAIGDKLGKTNFSTSCAPQTQDTFNRAIALLHSFQYAQAKKTFEDVVQLDPACAIAYWGQALTVYHPLWDWPSSEDLHQGHEYIRKANSSGTGNERELAYISAAAAFFRDDPQLDRTARVTAYSNAMQSLHERYPEDTEAAALYALSLISIPAGREQRIADRQKAIAILQKLFADQPKHPGAAQYLIHATDTAELAPIGLDAARRYARIAPESSHALHMPSHTFTRLGLWTESTNSNRASADAARRATQSQSDDQSSYQLHAMFYLEYAYLQRGENAGAQRIIDELGNVPAASPAQVAHLKIVLAALYAMENHQWSELVDLAEPSSDDTDGKVTVTWARAIGAARAGDIDRARQGIARLWKLSVNNGSGSPGMGAMVMTAPPHHEGKSVVQLEAEAWVLFAEGKPAKAAEDLLAAAAREETEPEALFGMRKPALEMLGDLQLEWHHPEKALAEYRRVLEKRPHRFNALYGAAHAAELVGNAAYARRYYSGLVEGCGPGADRPEVGKARAYLRDERSGVVARSQN